MQPKLLVYLVLAFTALFLWEHVAHVNDVASFRPSYPLTKLVSLSQWFFYNLGKLFGHIGSLITHLHLDKLLDTIKYNLNICYDLLLSLRYIKDGIEYVASYFENMTQVYDASVVTMGIVTFAAVCFVYEFSWQLIRRIMVINNVRRLLNRNKSKSA